MVQDEDHDSDTSENEEQHSNLLNAVLELDDTRRVRAPTKKELSLVVSEYHLPKGTPGTGDLVSVNELTNVLRSKSAHARIGNKVKNIIKAGKTLPRPLEKPVEERIKRSVGYLNVKGQLRKWNAIVEKNRAAEHLSFPLKGAKYTLQSSQQFLSKFKPKTPLEIAMSKMLGGEKGSDITEEEQEANKSLEFPLTLEEMMEKKRELAQIRAKLSYQEAKAHRQSKIKSKKYHRILKREKIKRQFKEFEQLVKSDPEAALKKLEELDRSRAQERASLRHKNTGKWARSQVVRAKYNKDSRKVLAEQLKLSRDITGKVKSNIHSDEDVSDQEKDSGAVPEGTLLTSNDNPWALNVSSEVTDFVSNCREYWRNKKKDSEFRSESSSSGGNKPDIPSSADLTVNDNAHASDIQVDSVSVKSGQNQVICTTDLASDGNSKKLNEGDVKSAGPKKKLNENIVAKSNRNCKTNISNALSENTVAHVDGKEKNCVKSKGKGRKKSKSANVVQSTFGSWTVTDLDEKRKRKSVVDIDSLFDDLDEKLADDAPKKLERIKKEYSSKKKGIQKVESDSDTDEDLSLKKNPVYLRPELDEELGETANEKPENIPVARGNEPPFKIPDSEKTPDIDPSVFIDVKMKKLHTRLPDAVTDENFLDDEEEGQKINVMEAFADDDVIEEFKEMEKEEEENKELEIPDALPGWGSWGGADIEPSERKNKRNMINTPKLPPKKDAKDRKDIIVREKANQKTVEHMVKDIPHPFQSVGAFESNIRQPIGREWVPETAHRKFIKKPVETQMGAIIDPMDENDLLRLAKNRKSLYRGKKKDSKK